MAEPTPEAELRNQISYWQHVCDPNMGGYEQGLVDFCGDVEDVLNARAEERAAVRELVRWARRAAGWLDGADNLTDAIESVEALMGKADDA